MPGQENSDQNFCVEGFRITPGSAWVYPYNEKKPWRAFLIRSFRVPDGGRTHDLLIHSEALHH
jgi:hypothetical protein